MKKFKEYLSESIYKEETYDGDDFYEAYGELWFNEDDVVDEADYRRNWFSIKGLWKNKIAVLSGDFILSRGMLLALENKEYRIP